MATSLSRRNMLKLGGLAALGTLGASALAGCGAPQTTSGSAAGGSDGNAAGGEPIQGSPSFFTPPAPVTDFADTKEYDVVVVGAGESGLSAVHTALEAGASVACVQSQPTAETTGNMAACIDLSKTDEAAIQACASFINYKSDFRSDRALVNVWARNSQEAIGWWEQEALTGGVESKPWDSMITYNGYDIYLHANTYFHVEGNHKAAALVIADNLEKQGAEFFYETPMEQLQVEDGAVTGVICTDADGNHLLFKASKGVIVACGDYSSNREMLDYYAPDTKGFGISTEFRNGLGMQAGMWAGAIMQPTNHTKMIHGEPAPTRFEVPTLFLNQHGERFTDETNCRMGYSNNFVRPYMAEQEFNNQFASKFWSIVPADWENYIDEWKQAAPFDISIHNAYRYVDPENWVQGETIAELVENMNAYEEKELWDAPEPLDASVVEASINRYNELCAKGADEDFGKSAKYMVPINGGPYYAVPRGSNRVSAILGGLVVDTNHQCLNAEFKPIPGLFAVGNCAGGFYGGVDYPMDIEGLSIGRAITSGYVTGKYVASL